VSSQPSPNGLSPDLLQALQGVKSVRLFPKGSALFEQGRAVTGVYLVESGEVHVLLSTGPSQKQLLEVVGPGAILGLSASMTGESYRVTAEAGTEMTASFIRSDEFLRLLSENCDFCMQIVRLLSEELHGIYQKFRGISAHPGRPRQRLLGDQLN